MAKSIRFLTKTMEEKIIFFLHILPLQFEKMNEKSDIRRIFFSGQYPADICLPDIGFCSLDTKEPNAALK